jgi:hypothetical protein
MENKGLFRTKRAFRMLDHGSGTLIAMNGM